MQTLLFSRQDISRIVHAIGFDRLMDVTISGIRDALREFDPTAYSIPVRSGFTYDDESGRGLLEWMPVLRYGDRVVVKLVGYHPDNPQQFALPTILSTIVTFDTCSGHARSIVDGTFLTSLRTGAASAVASSVLASPGSRVLGLIGAGAQAVTQLHALSREFPLEQVLIHDIDMAACNSFARRAGCTGLDIPIDVRTLDDVLQEADIVCTSTSMEVGAGPLFEDCALRSHVHFNAIGSDFPGKFELPIALLRRSLVCPDFIDQAILEGECQQLDREDIGPDLPTLVREAGQFIGNRDSMTVFDSTGWALEDLITSEIIASLGAELDCGTAVELQCIADDPKNPYGFINDNSAEQAMSIEKLLGARGSR